MSRYRKFSRTPASWLDFRRYGILGFVISHGWRMHNTRRFTHGNYSVHQESKDLGLGPRRDGTRSRLRGVIIFINKYSVQSIIFIVFFIIIINYSINIVKFLIIN